MTFIIYLFLVLSTIGQNFAGQEAIDVASDYILNGLNKDVKPCDDVFNFVCGKWLEKFPIKDENDTSNFFFETNRIENETRKVLLNAINDIDINDKTTPQYKIWLKTYYEQCLKSDVSETETAKQIFNGLQRIIGPPPLLTLNKTVYDILIKRNVWNLLGHLQRKLREGVFFKTSVENVKNDCGKTVPVLSFQPPYITDYDEELNATEIKESVMIVANIFQVPVDVTSLDTKIDNMIKLNSDLKQYLNDSENVSPEVYYEIYEWFLANSTDQLLAVNPKINWTQFFEGLFSSQIFDWDKSSAKFQLRNKKYFEKIDDIVTKYDVETIFNFMFYKSMNDMHRLAVIKDDDFLLDPVGNCIKNTQSVYGPAAAKIYFDFIKQDLIQWKSDMDIIADNIFTSFKFLVAKSDWPTVQEKSAIFKKVNSITYSSPIPTWLSSDVLVENHTIKFEPDKGIYDNAVNIAKWAFHMELDKVITGDVSDNDVSFYPMTYYSMIKIYFNLGFALPPYYHYDYPIAVKYGIFGNNVAQSLLQGFTKDNVKELIGDDKAWLNDTNVQKLDDQVSCIDNQIKDIECKQIPERCPERGWMWNYTINQLLTEIDGISVAYNAFKLASQNDQSQKQLPGLTDYNWDQIFLLSRGRSLCNSYNTDSYEEGGNSTTQSRLIKLFRNFPLYANAFQCSAGSQCYVAKPCGLWE